MGAGYLKVQVRTGSGAVPIEKAEVIVTYPDGRTILRTETDRNGNTEAFRIQAPDARFTLDPNYRGRPFSAVNVVTRKPGFITLHVQNVQIFDTATTILPKDLEPLADGKNRMTDKHIVIPPPGLLLGDEIRRQTMPPPPVAAQTVPDGNGFPEYGKLEKSVCVPEYITVHLGAPGNAAAKNIAVRFDDFIKNTVSGEIYPTWPKNAIEANISVIATFALNRVYTRWYRGRGYDFDITDSPLYDLCYRDGGPVFDSICKAADGLPGVYACRTGSEAPFFTRFCCGATAACNGFSQWGSLALASQGRTSLEILRYYYSNDIELVSGGKFDKSTTLEKELKEKKIYKRSNESH